MWVQPCLWSHLFQIGRSGIAESKYLMTYLSVLSPVREV